MCLLKRIVSFLLLFLMVCSTAWGQQSATSIRFGETEYMFRWRSKTQFEFTPKGQENLSHWVDMLTINYYPEVTEGEGLAKMANNTLWIYKKSGGRVIGTSSVPASGDKPAEHFISVVLGQPDFLEFVQARFLINQGIGTAVIYSHRVYDKEAGPEMSAWMKKHGASLENVLMALEDIPAYSVAKRLSY